MIRDTFIMYRESSSFQNESNPIPIYTIQNVKLESINQLILNRFMSDVYVTYFFVRLVVHLLTHSLIVTVNFVD